MARLVLSLPAVIIVILMRVYTPELIGDDAYMTFRVVRNSLEGNGFVYNPGEYFYVTTTVLWGNLLRALSFLFSISPENIYRPLNTVLDIANVVLVYIISSKKGERPFLGLIGSLLFSLSWFVNYSSLLGMESSLFIFIVCLGSLYFDGRKSFISAVSSACACILRPEGALFLVSRYFVSYKLTKKMSWREVGVVIIIVGTFVLSCLSYFGTIIPNAAIAKKLAYHREPFQALSMLADYYAITIFSPLQHMTHPVRYSCAFIFVSIWMYGAFREYRNNNYVHSVLFVFTVAVSFLYIVTNPLLFEWYVAPLTASYIVSLTWGTYYICKKIEGYIDNKLVRPLLTGLISFVVGAAFLRYDLPNFSLSMSQAPGGYLRWPGLDHGRKKDNWFKISTLNSDAREKLYIQLANLIKNDVSPQTLVLAPEFGAFGYYTQARIISSIGHNNPEMFQFLPVSREITGKHINNGISMDMINHFRPDYVLSLETFIRHGLLKSEEFQTKYELVKKLDSSVFGSKGLYLFRRKAKVLDK